MKAETLKESREKLEAAQAAVNEIKQALIDVNDCKEAFTTANNELLEIPKLASRWGEFAQLYGEHCAQIRAWAETIILAGDTLETPELFVLERPSEIDNANHAIVESYRAITRRLNRAYMSASGLLRAAGRDHWCVVATFIEDSMPADTWKRVAAWAVAGQRAEILNESFGAADFPHFADGDKFLDHEFALTQPMENAA